MEIRDKLLCPVEYKRGMPKAHHADEVQLCAQAVCLEEMTGHIVSEGALFYGKRHRRTVVHFDVELRKLTANIAAKARSMVFTGLLPGPVYVPAKCDKCSMKNHCRPRGHRDMDENWLSRRISRLSIPE